MPVVGMMHHKENPARVKKAYACAAVAKAEGISFYYFTPGKVDTENETICGFVYDDGRWIQQTLPYPDVVYNAGSPHKFKEYSSTINSLKRKIPFTTHSLGNKRSVYERLKKAKKYAQFLPKTKVIRTPSDSFQFLENYNQVVIKPTNGRKGIGIIFVEKTLKGIKVTEAKRSRILSANEFLEYIGQIITKQRHLVQPYIKSVTKSGLACDYRLHVQKNGQGEWVYVAAYVRVAPPDTIVCNISQGGYFNYLKAFLIDQYGEQYRIIRKKLKQFALGLAHHLDEIQADMFNSRLDELGIDIGIDEKGRIWLYEINWRPGSPPTLYLELDVVRNALLYAIHIARMNHKHV